MSKKTDLINIFRTYNSKYEDILKKINGIKTNIDITPIGAQKQINEIISKFETIATQYHDKAVSIIDDGVKALENKWKANSTGKLLDSNYQIGLANTIKMLEAGAITDKNDFKNIVDVYKDDYNALAIIRNLLKSDDPKYIEISILIPKDNRDYNKKILNDLRNNVDAHINPYTINNELSSMALRGMIQFVTDRLNNNLEIIPWEYI
ncbi:hypothetical protein PMX22_11695 [Clostridium butyricum]|uniref:hypothetical protein n=1 Tax=Clostridium butyricum TaxID=1492 RepID=UPI00232FF925|nr:hypothetical protein [Clostridium butyricum]MDB2160469.1 hypothetical protein [Clostridium butyricum]